MGKTYFKNHFVIEQVEVFGEYENRSLEDMISAMQDAIQTLPEELQASAKFSIEKIDKSDRYEESFYCSFLMMTYSRPENEKEKYKRESEDLYLKELQERREREQYETLSKKFGNKE